MKKKSGKERQFDKMTGDRIRMCREIRGLSQEKLAEAAGLSVQSISNIETGKTGISGYRLHLIADRLQVSTAYLVQEKAELYDEMMKGSLMSISQYAKADQRMIMYMLNSMMTYLDNIKES